MTPDRFLARWADATRTPFPAPRNHRIAVADLADPSIRERLRAIWPDLLVLDPTRRARRVAEAFGEAA